MKNVCMYEECMKNVCMYEECMKNVCMYEECMYVCMYEECMKNLLGSSCTVLSSAESKNSLLENWVAVAIILYQTY